MPALNPEIFEWARKTAGLSLDEAAHAIELKEAHGVSGAQRLAALEAGKEEPSRPLLLRMAKVYRRFLRKYLKGWSILTAPMIKGAILAGMGRSQ